MRAARNSVVAAVGALVLVASLFLPWSHLPLISVRAAYGPAATFGIPANPTGWEVYAAAAVVLAVLGAGLLVAAVAGASLGVRAFAVLAAVLAVAFVVHAIAAPPTNGLLFVRTVAGRLRYAPIAARAGLGETVALVGLGIAILALIFGFQGWAERPEPDPAAGLRRP